MTDLPIKKLTALTEHFGKDLLNDYARCDVLLSDFCSEYRLEVSLLVSALREGCASVLLEFDIDGVVADDVYISLVNKLQKNAGIMLEYGEWGVKGIAIVLGLEVKASAMISRLVYTDLCTSLMWIKKGDIAVKKMTYEEALHWVKTLKYCGYSDWRLPSIQELREFVEAVGKQPLLWYASNGFVNIDTDYYWSSSSSANIEKNPLSIVMNGGGIGYEYKIGKSYVLPVRG